MPDDDVFRWLMDWYARQCNGEWEHTYGVLIDTLDNPGWTIKIDLVETELADVPFGEVAHNLDADTGWWVCKVDGGKFVAACGPGDLLAALDVFRTWASAHPARST